MQIIQIFLQIKKYNNFNQNLIKYMNKKYNNIKKIQIYSQIRNNNNYLKMLINLQNKKYKFKILTLKIKKCFKNQINR